MSAETAAVDPRIHDINMHVKPGRTRAPFFRYFRINLPRLTRACIALLFAVMAALAFWVAAADFAIFAGAHIALRLVGVLAAVVAVVAAFVWRWKPWDFGLVPAGGAVCAYIGGLVGHAPYVSNGASVELAAGWNTMLLCAAVYFFIYWALHYGMIVAYPDDQGFED